MAAGDALSCLLVPRRPAPRLPLVAGRVPSLLLLRLDGIGDNVCSWTALELLRRHLPGTRISLAVGSWAAPLYRECPWIDEVIEWDSGLFGMFRGRGASGLWHDVEMSGRLKKRNFSAGIDLRGDLLSIVLLRLITPPIRVATVARGGSRLLTDPMQVLNWYEPQRTYDIARACLDLLPASSPRIKDWNRPEGIRQAREMLREAGCDESAPLVAICPLALWPWRQWPRERFKDLALRLKHGLSLQVVWFLENRAQADAYDTNDPVFCGSIDQVAAALSLCRLAVSNDSGLMHLAVAAGCRTIQLFGAGNTTYFAHHGPGLILHHDSSCTHYPCTQSGSCKNIEIGWCMDKISTEDVFASCVRLQREQ